MADEGAMFDKIGEWENLHVSSLEERMMVSPQVQ